MNKHLKYIDGTSDKFWQIEVNEASYTVTYGKNGTSGTSQTKSFDSNEACLKTAEKLLNEKLKKGYSENGEVLVSPGKPKPEKAGQSSKTDISVIIEAYDQLIKTKNKQGLLPFLEEYTKGNVEGLKKHIKKSKRYWVDYTDLSQDPDFKKRKGSDWGHRGDQQQIELVILSAIAVMDRASINAWDEVLNALKDADKPFTLEVLQWARPSWLGDFLLDRAKRNEWQRIDYNVLRFLETHGLLSFQPELYALCLGGYSEWSSAVKGRTFIRKVADDPVAYERDVPELFNYETGLNNSYFRDNDKEAYDAHHTWAIIYDTLLAEGKLSRDYFIEQTILIQTKDWNNTLKSFFRKKMIELDVQPAELLPHQESLFACLQHAATPVVNFAIELIKKIQDHDDFQVRSFLDWLEPLMMSSSHKGAVKTILTILEKLNKRYPEYHTKITSLLADIYVIPDLGLQEKASKLLLKIASGNDAELSEKLTSYAALMQGNVKSSLSILMNEEADPVVPETFENYQYIPAQEKVLVDEVVLPQDWNDILFLFGKFIASEDIIDAELLLNTLITQKHLFPEDYSGQLQPYHKQLEKGYFEELYKYYVSVFLKQKIQDLQMPFSLNEKSYRTVNTLLLIKPYLFAVQKRIDSGKQLPMLSFPTHLPYWVAPEVLLQRLITCQNEGEDIDKLDLSIAISRMPREDTAAAIPLLEQLSGELKDLMAFCLGVSKKITFKNGSFMNKLLSVVKTAKDEDLKSRWAMAARTYYPDETFPEFEGTDLESVPFAVSPFKPVITIDERWDEYQNYQTKKKERTPSWYEINFDLPRDQKGLDYFIYAGDLINKKRGWDYGLSNAGNVYHWNSMMPQNPDALAYFMLRSSCYRSDYGGHELKGFLNILNGPGFRFSEATTLVLACIFFQDKKDIRLMAAETLINLVERQALDLKLLSEKIVFLIAHKYGPFSRLVESLGSLKDNSPLHNAAFLQVMENIFKNLDTAEKLPVNFKKLVEHYVDILSKTNQQPDVAVSLVFEKLKDNAALKTLIKQILK